MTSNLADQDDFEQCGWLHRSLEEVSAEVGSAHLTALNMEGSKKLLMLGGSAQQVDGILAARQIGYEPIVCDFDFDCPGREFASRFYEVSVVDEESITRIAVQERVSGVVSFASDVAAPTAARVADRLGLPGNPPVSVAAMCDKASFRALLEEKGFPVPRSISVCDDAPLGSADLADISFPVIVKPVDSSGSRGVSRVESLSELQKALDFALGFSRCGRAIVEEFINVSWCGAAIEAEIFVLDGTIVSWGLMTAMRDGEVNELVPAVSIHPPMISSHEIDLVRDCLNRLISSFGIKNGPLNIEMVIDSEERVYVLDAGPRNGGNYLPRFFSLASGDDIVEATLRVACGERPHMRYYDGASDCIWVQHIVHSQKGGFLKGIRRTEAYESALVQYHPYVKEGEAVKRFSSAGDAVGVAFLKFPADEGYDDLLSIIEGGCEVLVS